MLKWIFLHFHHSALFHVWVKEAHLVQRLGASGYWVAGRPVAEASGVKTQKAENFGHGTLIQIFVAKQDATRFYPYLIPRSQNLPPITLCLFTKKCVISITSTAMATNRRNASNSATSSATNSVGISNSG